MGQGIRNPGHWGQPPMGQTSVMVESQLLSWHPPKPTHAYIHAHTSNEMSPKGPGEDPAGFTTFPVETPSLGQWSKEKASPGGIGQVPGLLLTHSPCTLTLGCFQNPVCVAFCSAKLLKARSEAKSKVKMLLISKGHLLFLQHTPRCFLLRHSGSDGKKISCQPKNSKPSDCGADISRR